MVNTELTPAERIKALTDQLEAGVKDIFESGRYAAFLQTMSKFHSYSAGNVVLIFLQCPHASRVAGFQTWKREFGRTVKKGEKGIRILAPCPYKLQVEQNKIDPHTHLPVLDAMGEPVKENKEIKLRRFKIATVFDVSQTEGRALPSLGASELTGEVAQYGKFVTALEALSPVPILYEPPPGRAKGCYRHVEQDILVRPGMSQVQTIKTLIHETAHAILHAPERDGSDPKKRCKKDRHTREVEAESVAYVVCSHFGIDTSEYSFGYVAGWSKGKELEELKSSLDCIRKTASGIIGEMEHCCPELAGQEPKHQQQKHEIGGMCK